MTDRDAHDARDHKPDDDDRARTPPHLDESVRRIGAAGRATLDSALDTSRALRKLVSADLVLARSALGRALAWVAVAIVFGASALLLTMGMLTALLHAQGLSWLTSFAICAAVNLLITVLAAWRVSVFFDHAGLHATRRQLARFGIGGGHEDKDEDDAGTCDNAPGAQAGAS